MLRGLATILLLTGNLLLWGIPVALGGLVKLVTWGRWRRKVILAMTSLAERWVGTNNRIFDLTLTTHYDIHGVEGIEYDGHYLIVSNHVSWVDIFVLFRAFHGHAAFLRFFLKQVLIWFPIAGQACWALEFPFMRRYTAEYLAQHPEKRGKDLETTRIACQRYRTIPVAIINFIEGTRFTREKQADQDAPYQHLLRPRVGGIAFVLASLGDQLDAMFDVTLVYPRHDVTMLEFITNRVRHISVHVRRLDVPAQFLTEEVAAPGETRRDFRAWIEQVWAEKDLLISKMIDERPPAASS